MKIVTSVVNNPIFIEIQYHTIKRFVKGKYDFIVFNDAKSFPDFTNGGDPIIKLAIESTCQRLGIEYINIPNSHHQDYSRYNGCAGKAACLRTEDSLRYILNYQMENPDCYLGLDSDMFFVNDFHIDRYRDYHAAIVPQYRNVKQEVHYFWNGLYHFNIEKMKDKEILNWDGSPELSCDSGGMMKDWLAKQDERDLYRIKHLVSTAWDENDAPDFIRNNQKLLSFLKEDPRNLNGKIFCELYDNTFLHYRAGGNWNGEGINFHLQLSNLLKEVLC